MIVFVAAGAVRDVIGRVTRCCRLTIVSRVNIGSRVDVGAVIGADLGTVDALTNGRSCSGERDRDVDTVASSQRATGERCGAITVISPGRIVEHEASRQEVGHIERASIDRSLVDHGDRELNVRTNLGQAIGRVAEAVVGKHLDECKVEVLDTNTRDVVIVFITRGVVDNVVGRVARARWLIIVSRIDIRGRVDIVTVVGADLCTVHVGSRHDYTSTHGDSEVFGRTSSQRATGNRCRAITIVGPRSIVEHEASRDEVGDIKCARIERALVRDRDREGHVGTGIDDRIGCVTERVRGVHLLKCEVEGRNADRRWIVIVLVASGVVDLVIGRCTRTGGLSIVSRIGVRSRVDVVAIVGADLCPVDVVAVGGAVSGERDRDIG